jgi:hypothetical protein
VDNRFSIVFSSSTAPPAAGPGGYGYVHSNPAGTVLDSYNSVGGVNSVVAGPPGTYTATLTGVGAFSTVGGVQVTAAGGPSARCKIGSWSAAGGTVTVQVRCVNAAGAAAVSGWTLSYQRQRSVSGAVNPPTRFGYFLDTGAPPPGTSFNSAGAINTVVAAGTGLRFVTFPSVGALQDQVQVTAYGTGPEWCGLLTLWTTFGGDAFVRDVICFDNTGNPSTQPSSVTYTSRA